MVVLTYESVGRLVRAAFLAVQVLILSLTLAGVAYAVGVELLGGGGRRPHFGARPASELTRTCLPAVARQCSDKLLLPPPLPPLFTPC